MKTPCGRCDAGVYAVQASLMGIAMFMNCRSKKEALKQAPRCKTDPTKICMGCRDFIVCQKFPMTAESIIQKVKAIVS